MSGPRFGSTLWTLIGEAQAGNRAAVDRMLALYRPGLVSFALTKGLRMEEAEDAAQETLIRLTAKLSDVDASKGRFRSLVWAITHNVVRELLRKRDRSADLSPELSPTPEPELEEAFDRTWVWNLVMVAMGELAEECRATGTHFHAALSAQLDGLDHARIAERLGAERQQVKGYIRHAREKLRRNVRRQIAEYACSDEYESECHYLLGLIDV